MSNPAILLAIGAGLVVVLFLLLRDRGREFPHEFPRSMLPQSPPAGSADWDDPLPTARHDERRRSVRRTGMPTPILVFNPREGRRAVAVEAFVLDRSFSGLRMALERPYPVGSVLQARPSNAPEGFAWVKVTVKNCREVGDYFEVGCQFESDLELSRLLMFG